MLDSSLLGGVETVSNRLIKALSKDYEISILSLYCKNKEAVNHFPDYVNQYTLQFSDNEEMLAAIELFFKNNSFYACINQIQELNISALIAKHCYNNDIKVYSVLHNSPLLYKVGFDSSEYAMINLLKKIKRRFVWQKNKKYFLELLRYSNKFVCISENCFKEFKDLNFNMQNVVILYNLLDSSFGSEYDLSHKENMVIYAGRLVIEKKVLELLQCWEKIKNKHNWTLYIVGSGYQETFLKEYAEKNQIQNVVFTGHKSDIRNYLAKSKIAILNSLTEGLPTFLIEAGVFKNVLIGRDSIGGTRDVIKNNHSGYLITSKNELLEKLELLINNPQKINELSANSNYVNKFFDSKIIENWKDILKNK
ncbi:MAG: glycosyltransferase [Chryseobacterium jejuense]|uniref:glycosyltransferase n=1 Tax=Chryseobacterium jejuense TaxID=445960 RepID=UPI003D0AFEE0